ncbi:HECT-type E3 ubiquitin transferase [Sarracenia purpurea var. burkii]
MSRSSSEGPPFVMHGYFLSRVRCVLLGKQTRSGAGALRTDGPAAPIVLPHRRGSSMSRVETLIDSIHSRLDRLSSKRELDEYGDTDDEESLSDLISVRMRKDEHHAVNSTSTTPISSSNSGHNSGNLTLNLGFPTPDLRFSLLPPIFGLFARCRN